MSFSLPIPFRNTLSQRLQRFFAQRAPRDDDSQLGMRNVYIFFSREGLLFAALLLITFIAGINYANNLILGLCFYLASIWLVSLHLTFAHVSGLKVRLLEVSMAQAGEPAWATIELISDNARPRRQLQLRFEQPASVQTAGQKSIRIASLKGRRLIVLPIASQQRGQLILPRLVIHSVYPLGIMRAWAYVYFASPAWVYPKPLAFEFNQQQMYSPADSNDSSFHHMQGQDDFDKLDDYVPGESLARVSWAHLARGQGMLSKHFADPIGQQLSLDYAQMPAAHHEQKLAQLSHALLQLSRTNLPYRMHLPNDSGAFGQGEAFLRANLLRLAQTP